MGSLFGAGKGPPGGLSINTAAANSSTSQPPPSVSLFPPKSGGGLFGGSSSTATSAGTLFGGSTAATTQAGSLFGGTATAPSQAGTLFGGAAASTQAATGGLFGGVGTGQAQAGTTAAPSNNLFGTTATSSSSNPFGSLAASKPLGQPQQGSNLFGSVGPAPTQQNNSLFGGLGAPQQQQQQPQAGNSLFGSGMQQPQQQQTGTSLFGLGQGQAQPQQKMGASLFGASQPVPRSTFPVSNVSTLGAGQQPQRSVFSASIGQYTQAAQTVPGVRISLDNLRPTTRFEDLHEDLQKGIEQLDHEILSQMRLADECAALLPSVADVGKTIQPDVAFLEAKLDATRTALVTDATSIDSAKKQVRTDAQDAQRSFHTIAALRMPSHLLGRSMEILGQGVGDPNGAGAPGDPTVGGSDITKQGSLVNYFSGQAETMKTRLAQVQRNFGEVEEYLSGLEAQTAVQVQNLRMGKRNGQSEAARRPGPDERIRELAAVLREFETGILTVAASVGQAREMVQQAQLSDSSGPRWRR